MIALNYLHVGVFSSISENGAMCHSSVKDSSATKSGFQELSLFQNSGQISDSRSYAGCWQHATRIGLGKAGTLGHEQKTVVKGGERQVSVPGSGQRHTR